MSIEVDLRKSHHRESGSSSGTQDRIGKHEGRSYRFKDKYTSVASVLPDLLFNLLNGCREKQSFELYSSGRRQGGVNFQVVDPETFQIEKSMCGSLQCSHMTSLFWKFVNIPNLRAAFDVEDERARQCIQIIFESVLKGIGSGTVNFIEGSQVRFKCGSHHFTCKLISERTELPVKCFEKVNYFFKNFNSSDFYGQLK